MFKHTTILLMALLSVSISASEMDKVEQILDSQKLDLEKAKQEYDRAVDRANQKAMTGLRSALTGAKDPAKVTIYKAMLRIDPRQKEAIDFFTALGTLNTIQAELNQKPAIVGAAPARFTFPKTSDEFKEIKGEELKVDVSKPVTMTAFTIPKGAKIRIVVHPSESWTMNADGNESLQSGTQTIFVKTEDSGDWKLASKLPDGIIEGSGRIQFRVEDRGRFKRHGSITVKLVAVQ